MIWIRRKAAIQSVPVSQKGADHNMEAVKGLMVEAVSG